MSDDTNACLELPQQPHGLAQERYDTQSVLHFPPFSARPNQSRIL